MSEGRQGSWLVCVSRWQAVVKCETEDQGFVMVEKSQMCGFVCG